MMFRLLPYFRLMRLDRPIGVVLLLWPTLWALWLAAQGIPSTKILVVFIFGTVIMRSAGCVINDYADRNFDGAVARTKHRPFAVGAVNTSSAIVLFLILCLVAFALVLQLNKLTIQLSFIAVLLAFCYPFTKRFFAMPQLVLGLAFSWSIPMAFAAVTNHVTLSAWILFIATFCWIVAYDTEYAMADREDDEKIGIHSSAIFFGRLDRFWIACFQLVTIICLVLLGVIESLAGVYFLSLLISVVFFCYQHWLIAGSSRQACFKAFLNNHWVGLIVFCGIVLSKNLKGFVFYSKL